MATRTRLPYSSSTLRHEAQTLPAHDDLVWNPQSDSADGTIDGDIENDRVIGTSRLVVRHGEAQSEALGIPRFELVSLDAWRVVSVAGRRSSTLNWAIPRLCRSTVTSTGRRLAISSRTAAPREDDRRSVPHRRRRRNTSSRLRAGSAAWSTCVQPGPTRGVQSWLRARQFRPHRSAAGTP